METQGEYQKDQISSYLVETVKPKTMKISNMNQKHYLSLTNKHIWG